MGQLVPEVVRHMGASDEHRCYHTASGAEIASLRFQSPYQPWAVSAVHGAARHIPYNIVTCCCMKSLCVVEGRALLRQMQSVNQTYPSIPQSTISDVMCPTLCNELDRERDSVPCRSSSACQTQPLPTLIWCDSLSRHDAFQCDYEGMATGSRRIVVKTLCVALLVLFLLRRDIF